MLVSVDIDLKLCLNADFFKGTCFIFDGDTKRRGVFVGTTCRHMQHAFILAC